MIENKCLLKWKWVTIVVWYIWPWFEFDLPTREVLHLQQLRSVCVHPNFASPVPAYQEHSYGTIASNLSTFPPSYSCVRVWSGWLPLGHLTLTEYDAVTYACEWTRLSNFNELWSNLKFASILTCNILAARAEAGPSWLTFLCAWMLLKLLMDWTCEQMAWV